MHVCGGNQWQKALQNRTHLFCWNQESHSHRPNEIPGLHQSGLAPKRSCKPSKGLELEHALKGPLCPWYFCKCSLIVLSKSWVSLNWNLKRYRAQTCLGKPFVPSQSEALFVGHMQMPLVSKELRSTIHLAIHKSLFPFFCVCPGYDRAWHSCRWDLHVLKCLK